MTPNAGRSEVSPTSSPLDITTAPFRLASRRTGDTSPLVASGKDRSPNLAMPEEMFQRMLELSSPIERFTSLLMENFPEALMSTISVSNGIAFASIISKLSPPPNISEAITE
jgi:hypothetical protein